MLTVKKNIPLDCTVTKQYSTKCYIT